MANEEYLAILRQGVEVWNEWRENNSEIKPTLNGADLSKADLSGANLTWTDLTSANLSGANLSKANLARSILSNANFSGADLSKALFLRATLVLANLSSANFSEANFGGADITAANFNGANLSEAKLIMTIARGTNLSRSNLSRANLNGAILNEVDFSDSELTRANLSEAKLIEANLSGANLNEANLSRANLDRANFCNVNLSQTNLCIVHALETNFSGAILTGACIEDWTINSQTNLNNIICDYVYLRANQQERFPIDRKFFPQEFTKLFQKASSIIELIFQNGVDWIAFSYSFGKLKIENEGAELAVQSIESKGDGIVVVKVSISQDTNKETLYKEFMQGYEFAHKVLEEKYRAELSSKDTQISHYSQENQSQRENINNLFNLLQQLTEVQKLMVENPRKVSNYDQRYSQIAGGIVDANIVNAEQIGGNIQNTDNQEHPD
ncbi:hypothetical protein AMR41_27780 [Hapalosiphon sp. MRB220]|nr:hypothetical protein AMR41_27780 [Hapalosiphon sp. MRB220]